MATLSLLIAWPSEVFAQYLQTYLPGDVAGYQAEPGVTVASRLRPMYDPPGIRLNDFMLNPALTETMGYNSNVSGLQPAKGSWFVRTTPTVELNSNWSRDRLDASIGADSFQYLNTPDQNYTNWNLGLRGGYTIGENDLTVRYAHRFVHQVATDLGTVSSSTPIPYSFDDLRAEYTFQDGRFSFTPRGSVQFYQFGDATQFGQKISQQYQNRVVLDAGLVTRYALTDLHRLVLVIDGVDAHYTQPQVGQPSNDSKSFLVLGGIEYQASAVWRYLLLIGGEIRDFAAPQYPTHTAPIAEGSVIWSPSARTTVTGVLSRTIEDASAQGSSGYTYTAARLIVDHEYLHNLLLRGLVGVQSATYLQDGGTQSSVTIGAGAQWLINRNVRFVTDISYTDQTGGQNSASTNPFQRSGFTGAVISFGFRVAL